MEWSGKRWLALDAATPLSQAGLWRDGEWLAWEGLRGGAERSLFEAVERCLSRASCTILQLDGFFYCEGPGSMLGTRIASMAIRGWQSVFDEPRPIYSYFSLEAAARLRMIGGQEPPFAVISDARRGFWNVCEVSGRDAPCRIARLTDDELSGLTSPCFRLEEVRKGPCPVAADEISSDFSAAPGLFSAEGLLRQSDTAEVYMPASPEFKKWIPQRHR